MCLAAGSKQTLHFSVGEMRGLDFLPWPRLLPFDVMEDVPIECVPEIKWYLILSYDPRIFTIQVF